jgi:hypothetical protein
MARTTKAAGKKTAAKPGRAGRMLKTIKKHPYRTAGVVGAVVLGTALVRRARRKAKTAD